jgi:hypothetical protein
VHEDGLKSLISYGLTLNQLKTIKTTSCPVAHWYYINDLPTLNFFNIDHLELIRGKKEIERIKQSIYNNPQWINEITEKAKLNNNTVKEQVEADALYLYQQE